MLRKTPVKVPKIRSLKGVRVAVIASRYNAALVDPLVVSTLQTLELAQVHHVDTFCVPGAYEIPTVAMKLARAKRYHAIIALGVVLQGKTSHADHVALASSVNLQRISMETGIPIIHQILTPKNLKDARRRVQIRGVEAAQTAVEMVRVMQSLKG
jgi:6,7-dimethyl-8-ribityllumazine synthase